jgi:hypothetical protein
MISSKNYDEKSFYINKIFDDSKIEIKNEIPLNIIQNPLSTLNNKIISQTLSTHASYIDSSKISIKKEPKLFGNIINEINPLKMGKTINFFYIKNYPIFSIGPDFFYAFILLFIMTSIYFLFLFFLCYKSGNVLFILHQITFFIYFFSHFLSIFINPGIPSFNYIKINYEINLKNTIENHFKQNKFNICKNCNCIVRLKDKVKHCFVCNICYLKFHCHNKWIGHCVAKNNIIFFYLFQITFCFYSLICISILFVNIIKLLFKI